MTLGAPFYIEQGLLFVGACHYCRQALLVHAIGCTCRPCQRTEVLLDAQGHALMAYHKDCTPLNSMP